MFLICQQSIIVGKITKFVFLQAHVQYASQDFPGIIALLSATISANPIMLKIFQQQGYVEQTMVGILEIKWEPSHDDEIGKKDSCQFIDEPSSSQMELSNSSYTWRCCESAKELGHILCTLRRQQQHPINPNSKAGEQTALTEEQFQVIANWLPGEYEAWPADCDPVVDFIASKKVWILEDNSDLKITGDAATAAVHAVLFMGWGAHATSFAGIVAEDYSAFKSALSKAILIDPSCQRCYIDPCGSFDIERLRELGEVRDYIIMRKWLNQE